MDLTVVEGEAENISQTHIHEKNENMLNVLPLLPSPEIHQKDANRTEKVS